MIVIQNNEDRYSKVINYFHKIILDDLRGIDCFIAGGAVRSYMQGSPLKTDIDIFSLSENDMLRIKMYMISKNATLLWESDNGAKYKLGGKTFDLVKSVYGSPTQVLEKFDFTIAQFAVYKEKLYYEENAIIDLLKKQLMFNDIPYPLSTLKRVIRYTIKGFRICNGELFKLAEAINSLDKKTFEPVEIKQDAQNDASDSNNESSGKFSGFFMGID